MQQKNPALFLQNRVYILYVLLGNFRLAKPRSIHQLNGIGGGALEINSPCIPIASMGVH